MCISLPSKINTRSQPLLPHWNFLSSVLLTGHHHLSEINIENCSLLVNLISGLTMVVVQSFSLVRLFVTPWTAARQASLSFTLSQRLLKPMCIESVILSNHLILCYPLLLLPSIFTSIRAFHSMDKPCGRNSWDASIFIILMSSNQ